MSETKKEFSTDFTKFIGTLKDKFRLMIEDSTTGLEYYVELQKLVEYLGTIDGTGMTNEQYAMLQAVAEGSPKGAYDTVALLQAAHPAGASGIYVVKADGYWYFWNGTAWTAGALYQTSVGMITDVVAATQAAIAATEAAPHTYTLLSITTAPSVTEAGQKYYNATTKLLYTALTLTVWDAGVTPRLIDSFLFAGKEYKFLNNDLRTTGRGIVSNVRTSGNGAAGTTDTYTITYSDATTSTYTVTNGADAPSAYLGAIANNASAPTSGVSGWFEFSTAGVCTWLTGSPTVAIMDRVSVKFTAPSTYVYTYLNMATRLSATDIISKDSKTPISSSSVSNIINKNTDINLIKNVGTDSLALTKSGMTYGVLENVTDDSSPFKSVLLKMTKLSAVGGSIGWGQSLIYAQSLVTNRPTRISFSTFINSFNKNYYQIEITIIDNAVTTKITNGFTNVSDILNKVTRNTTDSNATYTLDIQAFPIADGWFQILIDVYNITWTKSTGTFTIGNIIQMYANLAAGDVVYLQNPTLILNNTIKKGNVVYGDGLNVNKYPYPLMDLKTEIEELKVADLGLDARIDTLEIRNEDFNINLNTAVGTSLEKSVVDSPTLSVVDDIDSPFVGILSKCVKGPGVTATGINIDNSLFLNPDVNTIAFSYWFNKENLIIGSPALYLTSVISVKFTDNSYANTSFNIPFSTLAGAIGSITTGSVDSAAMTTNYDATILEKVGNWFRVIINYHDIVWKTQTKTISIFRLYNQFIFVTGGYSLIQNSTFLVGNNIIVNPFRQFIYADGLDQLQYPYATDQIGRRLNEEIVIQRADKAELIAANGNTPLTGKNVVFIADSLGAASSHVNANGLGVTEDTFNTLPAMEQDVNAKLIGNIGASMGTDIYKQTVTYPYWICKTAHCKGYHLMQSGWKMINGFAVIPAGFTDYPMRFTNIGKVFNVLYSGTTVIGTEIVKEYTPDYIIFSFGTNDNTDLGNGSATLGVDINSFTEGFVWDTSKVWDAWNKVLIDCYTRFPFAKIGLICDGSTSAEQKTIFQALAQKYGCGFIDLQSSTSPALYYNAENLKTKFSPTPLSVAKRKLIGIAKNYDIGENIYNLYDNKLNLLSYDVIGNGSTYNPSVHHTLECHKLKATIIHNWMLTL